MKIALTLAQIEIQPGKPAANLAQAQAWIKQSAAQTRGDGVDEQVILLPELWTTGYDLANAQALARKNAALLPEIARLASEHQVHIGGSMLLDHNGKIYNRFVFQSPGGAPPVTYSKIHLFRLMDEEKWLTPGEDLQLFQAPWGETGLAICYDLRFPEMFRRYAVGGARLILISAEWPAVRIAHWQTLLRARAIENQCFVAAVNNVGLTFGETFGGHSAVISPWGETLCEGSPDRPERLVTIIDLDEVQTVRQRIPILQDRRPDIYGAG